MSKKYFREHLGSILKAHRLRLNMSQEQVGDKLDISYQQVQKYEYGRSKITVERLLDFASVFGVTPESILLEALPES